MGPRDTHAASAAARSLGLAFATVSASGAEAGFRLAWPRLAPLMACEGGRLWRAAGRIVRQRAWWMGGGDMVDG